jgi:tRNA threonylcarbamoyladenosine biosynthesis protein TsaB
MSLILAVETTTKNCSVALFENEILICFKEQNSSNYIHSESLIIFIQDVMSQAKKNMIDLDCVAVSKGPGSFTGLRIGLLLRRGYVIH